MQRTGTNNTADVKRRAWMEVFDAVGLFPHAPPRQTSGEQSAWGWAPKVPCSVFGGKEEDVVHAALVGSRGGMVDTIWKAE